MMNKFLLLGCLLIVANLSYGYNCDSNLIKIKSLMLEDEIKKTRQYIELLSEKNLAFEVNIDRDRSVLLDQYLEVANEVIQSFSKQLQMPTKALPLELIQANYLLSLADQDSFEQELVLNLTLAMTNGSYNQKVTVDLLKKKRAHIVLEARRVLNNLNLAEYNYFYDYVTAKLLLHQYEKDLVLYLKIQSNLKELCHF